MKEKFQAPKYAVPGVIAEGVNLLAGAPKIGKSWLSLGLAVAVATGGKAFGSIDVPEGDVLYLALEDTGRRLQSRLCKVLDERDAPERLTLETECPRFPEGGAHIRAWLDERPEARLVVVDVLARMRGVDNSTSAYSADYAAVTQVKQIADDYGIALVLVHHVRKAASEDYLTEVSGTNGIAGAADAVLVLKRSRGEADGALHVTGRDVDETEYALTFDAELGSWKVLPGPALDHLVSDTRKKLLTYVREHPDSSPKSIAEATGLGHDLVKKTLNRMADEGQLIRPTRGSYSAVSPVSGVSDAGQSPHEGVSKVSPVDTGVPRGLEGGSPC
ncbi:MAG: DNA repair protein RadA [Pseudonocardia sp. 73-21]|nr:MAG: DNA repair protein RadA [Pseudonocardia sp. 73-21]